MDAPDKFVAAVLTAYIMHTKKETFAKEFVEENYEGLNDTQKRKFNSCNKRLIFPSST